MGLAPSLETTAPPLTRGAVDGAGQVQAEAHSWGEVAPQTSACKPTF